MTALRFMSTNDMTDERAVPDLAMSARRCSSGSCRQQAKGYIMSLKNQILLRTKEHILKLEIGKLKYLELHENRRDTLLGLLEQVSGTIRIEFILG